VDGKVCALDFGFTKEWPPDFMSLWKEQSLAGYENNVSRFAEVNKKLGFGAEGENFDYQALLDLYRSTLYLPWLEDRPFRFTLNLAGSKSRHCLREILCPPSLSPAVFSPSAGCSGENMR